MMKKLHYLLAIGASCFLSLNILAQTGNWSDYATAVTPDGDTYSISTPEQLAWIGEQVKSGNTFDTKTIVLTSDIDLGAHYWTPTGGGTTGTDYKMFSGTLDGKNGNTFYKIKNLHIDFNQNYCGFIRHLSTRGTVRNLSIESGVIKGSAYAASLVGYNQGGVINCSNRASVQGWTVGGIVGVNNGRILSSYNIGSITSTAGAVYAGGVVSRNYSKVEGCYNRGTVVGAIAGVSTRRVGGIAGVNETAGTILGCYNTGATSTPEGDLHGAIAGINSAVATAIVGCFGDITLNSTQLLIGQGGSTGGGMVTSSVLKNDDALTELNTNSSNVYVRDASGINDGYPILQFQKDIETSLVDKALSADNLIVTSHKGMLKIKTEELTKVNIYSINGQLIKQLFVESEISIVLNKGIYLVNGKKVIL